MIALICWYSSSYITMEPFMAAVPLYWSDPDETLKPVWTALVRHACTEVKDVGVRIYTTRTIGFQDRPQSNAKTREAGQRPASLWFARTGSRYRNDPDQNLNRIA